VCFSLVLLDQKHNTDGQNIFFFGFSQIREIKNSYLNPRQKWVFLLLLIMLPSIDFIDFMNFHKMLNLIEIQCVYYSKGPELTTSLFSFRISEDYYQFRRSSKRI
jgi:hypothetical protein